ncbi:hypothetical protein [Streptomyces sp. NPDC001750]
MPGTETVPTATLREWQDRARERVHGRRQILRHEALGEQSVRGK